MHKKLGFRTTCYEPYRPEASFLERHSGFTDFKALEHAVRENWLYKSCKLDYKPYYMIKMPSGYGVPRRTDDIDGFPEEPEFTRFGFSDLDEAASEPDWGQEASVADQDWISACLETSEVMGANHIVSFKNILLGTWNEGVDDETTDNS